ncbi:sigma-70 family RNA polymerase sigma factor [Streptomyces sp. NPDC048489]|uniref:RNA polymerase sigma factor n=1 Tax=Streptomyces sp. NPDC048489 TaxID=3154504 RepID=UPI003427E63C
MKKKTSGAKVPRQRPQPDVLGAHAPMDGLPPDSREQWAHILAHQADFRGYVARKLGRTDGGAGADIVFNATLYAVYKTLEKGPLDHVNSFFFRVAHNEAVTYWRRLARQRLWEVGVGDDVGKLERADPSGEADASDRRQMEEYRTRLAAELSPKELAAFLLKEIDGLSAHETARAITEETGIEMTAGNVRQTVWRARTKLRTRAVLARLGLAAAE